MSRPSQLVLNVNLEQNSPQISMDKPNMVLLYTNEIPTKALVDNYGDEATYMFFSSATQVKQYFSINSNVVKFANIYFSASGRNAGDNGGILQVSRVAQTSFANPTQGIWEVTVPVGNLANIQAHDNLAITIRPISTSASDIELNIDGTKIKSWGKLADVMNQQSAGKATTTIATNETQAIITVTSADFGVDSVISLVQTSNLTGKTDASGANYFDIAEGTATNGTAGTLDVTALKTQIATLDTRITKCYTPCITFGFPLTEQETVEIAQYLNTAEFDALTGKTVNLFSVYQINQQNASVLEDESKINPRLLLLASWFREGNFTQMLEIGALVLAYIMSANVFNTAYSSKYVQLNGLNLDTGNRAFLQERLAKFAVHNSNEDLTTTAALNGAIAITYNGSEQFQVYERARTIDGVLHTPTIDILFAQIRGRLTEVVNNFISLNGTGKDANDLLDIVGEVMINFQSPATGRGAIIPDPIMSAETQAIIRSKFAPENVIGIQKAIDNVKLLGYTFQTKSTAVAEASKSEASLVAIFNTPIGIQTINIGGAQIIQ